MELRELKTGRMIRVPSGADLMRFGGPEYVVQLVIPGSPAVQPRHAGFAWIRGLDIAGNDITGLVKLSKITVARSLMPPASRPVSGERVRSGVM